MQSQQIYVTPFAEVFMFVNSGSGGGLGVDLLEKKLKNKIFEVSAHQSELNKNSKKVNVAISFYNMKDKADRDSGFVQLKHAIQQNKKVILVICGGDGTIMWVVSQLHNHKIDHMKAPIAMIPLGTGNDFSRTLGWGGTSPDLIDNDLQKLKKRITYWLSAVEQNLDIWMVKAQVHPFGKFQRFENEQDVEIQGKTIQKHFCNYFSVGIDGKIGYSFDKHRTSTRLGNLIVYGALGLSKSLEKTKSLEELGISFRECMNPSQQMLLQSFTHVIFEHGDQLAKQVASNQNLMALNINSLMGGCVDVWRNAKAPPKFQKFQFAQQSHSDGKIQFVSFGGAVSLGLQKSIGGKGQKVYQGSGPFEIKFDKPYQKDEPHRTYLQIDGEFLRYTHPLGLVIQKSTLSETGKIRVLRRVPKQVQKGCCGK